MYLSQRLACCCSARARLMQQVSQLLQGNARDSTALGSPEFPSERKARKLITGCSVVNRTMFDRPTLSRCEGARWLGVVD